MWLINYVGCQSEDKAQFFWRHKRAILLKTVKNDRIYIKIKVTPNIENNLNETFLKILCNINYWCDGFVCMKYSNAEFSPQNSSPQNSPDAMAALQCQGSNTTLCQQLIACWKWKFKMLRYNKQIQINYQSYVHWNETSLNSWYNCVLILK